MEKWPKHWIRWFVIAREDLKDIYHLGAGEEADHKSIDSVFLGIIQQTSL
jgi:hypothetical protein